MCLLAAIGPKLDREGLALLETAILSGPPRMMYKDDIEPERWTTLVDHKVWQRLTKADVAGMVFGDTAKLRQIALTEQYPELRVSASQRDEIPSRRAEDDDEGRKLVPTPRRRRELVAWLKQFKNTEFWQEDDWTDRCRHNFATSACALYALACEDIWPPERWREALQAWSEDKLLKRSWRYMAPVLVNAPDALLQSLAHGISWWLQATAKTIDAHENIFFNLCRLILDMDCQDGIDTNDPVAGAINHPVGHVTEALLRWWYRRPLEDGQGLPEELKPVFNEICDTQISKFRHGRVLLGAHVIALYRVDRDWATTHLLPLFDWRRSPIESRSAWEGFLWSPRLYRPLMEAMKDQFLDTANHYESLGKHDVQYAALLTFAALDRGDTFSIVELSGATRALPANGLGHTAQTLVRALDGAGEQRADYWTNRILPYLQTIWPKSRDLNTPTISEALARLCIAAQDAFPVALHELKFWLQRLEQSDHAIHLLYGAKLCERFPDDALTFLDTVINNNTQWPPRDLKNCLETIRQAQPSLENERRYQRLTDYLRRQEER
jgi:hypothetical protein